MFCMQKIEVKTLPVGNCRRGARKKLIKFHFTLAYGTFENFADSDFFHAHISVFGEYAHVELLVLAYHLGAAASRKLSQDNTAGKHILYLRGYL